MAVTESAVPENVGRNGVFSDVISLHKHLVHATNLQEIREVVIEAGTFAGEVGCQNQLLCF